MGFWWDFKIFSLGTFQEDWGSIIHRWELCDFVDESWEHHPQNYGDRTSSERIRSRLPHPVVFNMFDLWPGGFSESTFLF
jgi:hypothetical protein